MVDVDYDWVNKQLDRSGYPEKVSQTVIDFLGELETSEYTEAEQNMVADALASLVKGHALVPDEPDQVWVPVQMGFVHAGDIVRVKHDAFTGEAGKIHNGRHGKVQAARSGDVIFRSTDGIEPFLDGTHYPPNLVERRLR